MLGACKHGIDGGPASKGQKHAVFRDECCIHQLSPTRLHFFVTQTDPWIWVGSNDERSAGIKGGEAALHEKSVADAKIAAW
jgi:hypothetical protein